MNRKRFTESNPIHCGRRISGYGLSLADVYAALTYYYDHREEIDESILSDESFAAEIRSRTKSKLNGTPSG